ncbi:MAG: hypothetical protein ACYSVY_24250 [Planctomycetota bacterium]|jgi:hypothetical protein
MPERRTDTTAAADDPGTLLARACQRADRSNSTRKDAEAFARLLRQYPHALDKTTDLAAKAVDEAISRAHATPAVREVLRFSTDQLKSSLGYDKANLIERLLIDQVVVCYLRLNLTEQRYEIVMSDTHTLRLGAYWEKKVSAAQRRYLRAVETLARVRKLLGRPTIQVNIAADGGQQIVQNVNEGVGSG